jgi:hypothetical protein
MDAMYKYFVVGLYGEYIYKDYRDTYIYEQTAWD